MVIHQDGDVSITFINIYVSFSASLNIWRELISQIGLLSNFYHKNYKTVALIIGKILEKHIC